MRQLSPHHHPFGFSPQTELFLFFAHVMALVTIHTHFLSELCSTSLSKLSSLWPSSPRFSLHFFLLSSNWKLCKMLSLALVSTTLYTKWVFLSTLEPSNLTSSFMSNLCSNHSIFGHVLTSESHALLLFPPELIRWFNLTFTFFMPDLTD